MTQYTSSFPELMSINFFSNKQLIQVNPLEINFRALSRKKCINSSNLEVYPDADWDFPYLCQDNFFRWTDSIMKRNIHKMDHRALSKCEYFNLEWIEWYPEGEWDFSPISYFITELEEALKYQDRNLDFKILSNKSVNLNVDWFQIFKDKEWDFKLLVRHPNFKPVWLRCFPEKCWDFKDVSFSKKPITYVELSHFPNADWNFTLLSKNRHLEINWLQTLPNRKWNCTRVLNILNNKSHILLDLLYLQSHMHQIFKPLKENPTVSFPILKIIPPQKYISNYPLEKFVFWMVIFNPHNIEYIDNLLPPDNSFPFHSIEEIPVTSFEEKEQLYILLDQGILWESYYPGMLKKLEDPLVVYDLSGEEFTIDNWSEGNTITRLRNTYPNLGDIDIFLDSYYLSKMNTAVQKTLVLHYDMESDGLLVYQEIKSELPSPSQDEIYQTTLEKREQLYQTRYNIRNHKLRIEF